MNTVIPVYKPLGKTPLDMVRLYKVKFPVTATVTISYAGRLDPMAEGILLLLAGSANKDRKTYERYTKTYEFEMMLGITTDSFDLLGVVTDRKTAARIKDLKKMLPVILPDFTGNITQTYPPYSAYHVSGKPLYYWAREGKLDDIRIPSHEVSIDTLEILSFRMEKLARTRLMKRLELIHGQFRQEEIINTWNSVYGVNPFISFPTVKLRASCSGGTYIRQLVHDIGQRLGTGATTSSIIRTRVGPYTLNDCLELNG